MMATVGRRRIEELVEDIEAKKTEIESLSNQYGSLNDQAKAIIDEVKVKSASLDELKSQLSQAIEASSKAHLDSLKSFGDKIAAKVQESDQLVQKLNADLSSSATTVAQITANLTSSTRVSGQLEQIIASANSANEKLAGLAATSATIEDRVLKYEQSLKDLQDRQTKNLKTIESLLPGAASAGLASAFSKQKDAYKGSIRFWTIMRLIAVVLFLVYGIVVYKDLTTTMTQVQENGFWELALTAFVWLINKSPILLALILFEEFARRAYNRNFKLQEDYAYKQVISQSFEGYKKQFIDLGAAYKDNTALNGLCENTVKAMSESPIRLLNEEKDSGGRRWFGSPFSVKSPKQQPDGQA